MYLWEKGKSLLVFRLLDNLRVERWAAHCPELVGQRESLNTARYWLQKGKQATPTDSLQKQACAELLCVRP
jgi:hypothetical protein